MSTPLHFYIVFNPLLKPPMGHLTQAHEFHHKLRERVKAGGRNAHLYWGKIKKTNQHGKLDVSQYLKIFDENRLSGQDTYLFISDFNFFWVAKVEGITDQRPANHDTLPIYENEEVEIWFKIKDMDMLCAHPSTTRAKIAKLSYGDFKSLHPYIPGLRYPLQVDDHCLENYFAKYKDDKRVLLDNPMIEASKHPADEDARLGFTIPPENYQKLPPLLKQKIFWAEELFSKLNDQKETYTEDLSKVAFSYLKIIEAVLNFTLMREIDLRVTKDESYHDLSEIHQILNTLKWKKHNVDEIMRNTVHEDFWNFCKIDVRNFLHVRIGTSPVHSVQAEQLLASEACLFIRNSMLGVGCKGILNELIERYAPMERLQVQEDDFQKAG